MQNQKTRPLELEIPLPPHLTHFTSNSSLIVNLVGAIQEIPIKMPWINFRWDLMGVGWLLRETKSTRHSELGEIITTTAPHHCTTNSYVIIKPVGGIQDLYVQVL
jgi:hypothetical protein